MRIDIKHAGEAEIDQIVDLRRRAFSEVAPAHYSAREVENLLGDVDVTQLGKMIADKRLFCGLDGAQLLGTVGWDVNYLRHLYIAPSHFKKGFGSRLIEHAVADFRRRTTYDAILAGVILYARPFYEKCGFSALSEETAWDGSRYFLMRRGFVNDAQL